MTDSVLYELKGHTGYITLNRPQDGNRLDLNMAQELAKVCDRINEDGEVYLAVISGSGDIFCLGGDARLWKPDQNNADALLAVSVSPSTAVAGLNCPVIAAVNGPALGLGLELALSSDIRFASARATFGLPQITEGYIPLDGGTQRLPRLVGRGKALEMVLTGEILDAPAALAAGLVNKVLPVEEYSAWIAASAENIASKAPLAMRYVKEAVNGGLDLTLEQGLRLEADLYFLLHTTADRTEGITSFLQKRPPRYQGQ
jgi:enoyl-CoA hydratase